MNKIQKLKEIFHTDKWWGRVFLLSLFYTFFLIFGYWIWFLLDKIKFLDYKFNLGYFIFPIYFFVFLPVLSFILVFKIKKYTNLKIKKIILFFVNLLVIVINLFIFMQVILFSIQPNFF